MENTNVVYDILIVGGGPGGLSAALYAGRSEMKTLLLKKLADKSPPRIRGNYPALSKTLPTKLIERWSNKYNILVLKLFMTICKIENGDVFLSKACLKIYQAKTLIVGLTPASHLGIPVKTTAAWA